YVGVNLLVDDPLLAFVVEAEIAGPGPGRQMIDAVELRLAELQQVFFLDQVAIARVDDRHFRALFFEVGDQMATEKSCAAGNQYFHKLYSDNATARVSRFERATASMTACCRSNSTSKSLDPALRM